MDVIGKRKALDTTGNRTHVVYPVASHFTETQAHTRMCVPARAHKYIFLACEISERVVLPVAGFFPFPAASTFEHVPLK